MIKTTLERNHRHETFGGYIYASDFDTDFRGRDNRTSYIASRICNDWKFDEFCKKNISQRNRVIKTARG